MKAPAWVGQDDVDILSTGEAMTRQGLCNEGSNVQR